MKSFISHDKQFPAYINSLLSKGQYWFTKPRLREELGLSDGAINVALWRMGQKSAVCRIKRDFYVIVPPEHQIAACLPARWFIHPFMEYLKLPYYVGLLSAASVHGSAHQQVMMLQVVTTKQMRPINVANQHIRFYYKQNIQKELLESKKTPLSYFTISNLELTLFDLIKYAKTGGQLQQAATVIYELIENIKMDALIEFIKNSGISLPVAHRFGYVLDKVIKCEIDLSLLEQAINERKPRYIPLVSANDKVAYEKNQRWHVLVNADIELDEI
ncbi:MAG: type IV toxin-antitoxin system AbiEi family antitoxin [Pseudomonadota bacterium]